MMQRTARLAAVTPRGVLLDCGDNLTCSVSLLGPMLARVLFRNGDSLRMGRSWMVPPHGADDVPWSGRDRADESSWPVPQIALREEPGLIHISNETMSATIRLAPFGITWALADGRVFAADRAAQPYRFGPHGALSHAMARHQGDRNYGLGDKTGPLDLAGRRLRIAMTDALGFDPERGDPLYKHWPFLITRDGESGVCYGMLYDNTAAACFDLGCERDNYFSLYRMWEVEGGDLDYYIFPGPEIGDVTRRFLALTGRATLPPRWSLGFAQTAMAIADAKDAQAQMEGFIAKCATDDIPLSAFHFGSGYTMIGPRRYVFHWNREKYPDPPALMRRFHDAGIHLVANIKPCLLDDHPRFAEAAQSGAFIQGTGGTPALAQFWDGEGAHIDFTAPEGIDWWQRGVREALLEMGIDVAWNDNNEYRIEDENATSAGFGTPMPLALTRPLHPLLMTRASREAQQAHAPGRRAFSVTRAGCPGIQRYAQTWSGDNLTGWESLRWNLRTGLQMALSGMVNTGHDVGGFGGPIPEAELLVRWAQAGLLHPRFIMNSWKPDGVFTTPWLHPEVTPLIRSAIRLRYRLIPYLYSLIHASVASGAPVLQPLFVAYPQDPAAWDENQEMMLGPSLLAAPVTAPGERSRWAYLPSGPECWFDFHSGERLAPGARTQLAAPLERLPLVLPAGAILPLTDPAPGDAISTNDPTRCVLIAPGPSEGHSQFSLIEDDGISEGGPTATIAFTLHWNATEVTLDVAATGNYPLPYRSLPVRRLPGEHRPLRLRAAPGAPTLVRGVSGA